MEQITCQDCGETWERPKQRGRKPKRCADCAGRNSKAYQRYAARSQAKHRNCDACGCEMTTAEKQRRGSNGKKCAKCAPFHQPRLRPRSDDGSTPSRVTCRDCGEKLKGSQRFQCQDCAAPRKRPPLPHRVCVVCDREFEPNARSQVTCPPNEEELALGKNQSWCSAKHYRYKTGETKTLKATPPSMGGREFDCAGCGKSTVAGENGTHVMASKFCGAKCKSNWHSKHGPYAQRFRPRSATTQCHDCGELCRRVKGRKSRCSLCESISLDKQPRRWTAGRCLECGDSFIGQWHPKWPARYCCDNHAVRAGRRRSYSRRRTKTDKQRAEQYGVEYEPINRKKVFERDAWICHICGETTSKTYNHADPWSPTLDHIVPISQGGPHLYENVALAHAFCNAVKCDGRSGEDAATMLGGDLAPQAA